MSGVGRVADEVREARMMEAVANVEAESAKETLHTQTASFSAQAEASAGRGTEIMEGCVQQLAVHTDAQTLRVTEEVTE